MFNKKLLFFLIILIKIFSKVKSDDALNEEDFKEIESILPTDSLEPIYLQDSKVKDTGTIFYETDEVKRNIRDASNTQNENLKEIPLGNIFSKIKNTYTFVKNQTGINEISSKMNKKAKRNIESQTSIVKTTRNCTDILTKCSNNSLSDSEDLSFSILIDVIKGTAKYFKKILGFFPKFNRKNPDVPQSTPQPVPQSTPQPISQSTPQPVPQSTPQPIPQSTPQPISQSTPQSTPQPTSQPTPQSTPKSTPKSTSQQISQSTPKPRPKPRPRPTPRPTPQPTPQSTSQSTPKSASQQISPSTSQPRPGPRPQPRPKPRPRPQPTPKPNQQSDSQQDSQSSSTLKPLNNQNNKKIEKRQINLKEEEKINLNKTVIEKNQVPKNKTVPSIEINLEEKEDIINDISGRKGQYLRNKNDPPEDFYLNDNIGNEIQEYWMNYFLSYKAYIKHKLVFLSEYVDIIMNEDTKNELSEKPEKRMEDYYYRSLKGHKYGDFNYDSYPPFESEGYEKKMRQLQEINRFKEKANKAFKVFHNYVTKIFKGSVFEKSLKKDN